MRLILAFLLIGLSAGAFAQQPTFSRKLLQDQPLSSPDRHIVQALVEINAGMAVGKHTHPGEEAGYVVEGAIELMVEGQPPRTIKAGESFFVPAGVVHDGKAVGSGPAKVLATYIVEMGKPVATPVK